MERKSMINQLQLAYSPMSNYDFTFLRQEEIIQHILSESKLYMICQRPILSFDNLTKLDEKTLSFQISQKGNTSKLECVLPVYQEHIGQEGTEIITSVGSIDKNNKPESLPANNMHGMQFYCGEEFLFWISPEKFLHNYWRGHLEAEVKGNIKDFTKYTVHYVGKATKQNVLQRLTGHSTLQEILSVEYPLHYGDLPTHEIAILFFKFFDTLAINTFDIHSDTKIMAETLLGHNMPSEDTIFLDAEKAFIKTMQPKHNKEFYNNYPHSKDGLYSQNLDAYSFSIMDDITLVYKEGEIEGSTAYMQSDFILIKDNKHVEVIKISSAGS